MVSITEIAKNYSWYDQIRHVEELFYKYFGKNMELKDFNYYEGGMGVNFKLDYFYAPKNLKIIFECDRSMFDIYLTRKDNVKNSLNRILINSDKFENMEVSENYISKTSVIEVWVKALNKVLHENYIQFYKYDFQQNIDFPID